MDDEFDWRSLGECRNHDPELFFSGSHPHGDAAAKLVCQSCPVRTECLTYAVVTAQRYGVWGGVGADERALLRRRYVAAIRSGADFERALEAAV